MDASTMAAQLGFVAQFFQADPELARLLQNAVSGQWDVQRFQAAFMNTNWYRSRSASIRQWTDLEIRDPAEAARKVNERAADFRDRASQLGLNLDEETIRQYAYQSLQWAWSKTELTDIFASMVDYTPGNMGGTPAAVEMQVNKLANDYGLTLTGSQISSYVGGIMSEKYTEDNIRDFLRDMAKSKYVGMGAMLDMGMTVRDVAAPYVSSYANLLELNPDAVDMNDGVIQQALQGVSPAPGQPPQMQSVYQFERSVRRDPRWQRTKNARDSMTDAAHGVLRDWGLIA